MANIEPIFDTHAHIMSADSGAYPPSAVVKHTGVPPYTAEELLEDMAACNVTRACAVQRFHYYYVDNSYVLDASRPHRDRLTPVVMLAGQDPQSPDILRDMVKRQAVGALRFANTSDNIDTGWMNAPQTLRLWETAAELGLPVAIIFYLRQIPYNLPAISIIADMFPEMPIVIDHLGIEHAPMAFFAPNERITHPGPPDYAITPALKALRAHRNIHFKLTGINLEFLDAHAIDTAKFVRRLANELGAERIMVGTDIGQTKGPYSRIIEGLRRSVALLDADERAKVLFSTANRIFGRTFS